MTAALPEIRMEIVYGVDGLQHMLLNGQDVTEEIRLPRISLCASAVSAYPQVRAFLLEMQRELARNHDVIMKGLSTWQRAEAIISVAHPQFRDELIADAEKMHIWRRSNKN